VPNWVSPRRLRIALFVALLASLAAALALTRGAHPARAAASVPTLVLGQAYHHPLRSGESIAIDLPTAALPAHATVRLLAIGIHGGIIADLALSPSAKESAAGVIPAVVPRPHARPAYWIALAPVARSYPMRLRLAPTGPRRTGADLAAIVTGVPQGDRIYLLGVTRAGKGLTQFSAYVPPTLCVPNPPTGGMTICNFPAPPHYAAGLTTFEAFAQNGDTSLPGNDLPELPWPVLLLPLAFAAFLTARTREVPS